MATGGVDLPWPKSIKDLEKSLKGMTENAAVERLEDCLENHINRGNDYETDIKVQYKGGEKYKGPKDHVIILTMKESEANSSDARGTVKEAKIGKTFKLRPL